MRIDTRTTPIPAHVYPVTITLSDMMTRTELWTLDIPEPGIIDIPTAEEINPGKLVIVAIKGADGRGSQFPPEHVVERMIERFGRQ